MNSDRTPRHFFCSFGDSRMHGALERIRRQAAEIGVFDVISVHDESGLSPDFVRAYGGRMVQGSRGFGYWIWKPQIILQVMAQMNEGDRLLFTDAGCHINSDGAEMLRQYFARTAASQSGMLFTQLQDDYLEKHWTKGDVFDQFKCRDNFQITDTPQLQSGILFMEKRPETTKFVQNWAETCLITHLVDDSPSISKNFTGFVMNRHDQSIVSIMGKIAGVETTSADNFSASDGDWSKMKNQPIWIKRDKGIRQKLIVRLLGSSLANKIIIIRRKILHR